MNNLKRLIAAKERERSEKQDNVVTIKANDVRFQVAGEMFSIKDILVELDKKINTDQFWTVIIIALTIIIITLSAVFGVYATVYKASIASFEARVVLQKEIMVEYKDIISKQNDTINRQNDAITNLRIDIEVLKAK